MALRAGLLLTFVAAITACASPQYFTVPAAIPSSGTFTTSTSGSTTLPTLATSGITVTGSAPSANAAVTVTESLSTSAPGGVTAFKAKRDLTSSVNVVLYVTLSSTSTVTLSASPAFTFTSSSIASGTAYSLAEVSGSGTWTAPFAGPQTASSGSVAFASVDTQLTIAAGAPITFALYTGTEATPVASPASLLFDATNPTPMPFSVSETDYAGAFDATMTCTENPSGQSPASDAFVAQFSNGTASATATPASAGAATTFTVDGGAETGSCTATVTDSDENSATISITVSSTGVTVNRVSRQGTYIRPPGRE
ncbi:MAG TPA: hypothetical protein VMD47_02845 [Candidatus Acidoferrales bacterium]|nr:hypothetical protein [Candidatus Acidoferrales bacterium]